MNSMTNAQLKPDYFEWLAANPLLRFLPEELDYVGWGEYLRLEPAKEWNGPVPKAQRQRIANHVKRAYAPTDLAIHAALGLQNLLYTGLAHRDPRLEENRRWPYQTGALLGKDLDEIPWFPTYSAGATFRGITGCGKTACIERFISRYRQVVVHKEREDCAWLHNKQLVYLVVPMPADGSRGGLLLEIAKRIDHLLETDYAHQLRTKYKSVEKGLVAILHWLSLHRCGLLVIEETQERHVAPEVFGADFVTFFLRMLNFGVPLALVGNPLAFAVLDTFSQDVRRFSDGGEFVFDPVSDHRSAMWRDDLVPTVWGFNVFENHDEVVVDLNKLLWDYTGGIPDALARLRREALFDAIRMGGSNVTRNNITKAFDSRSMRPLHPLIDAFKNKSPTMLRDFKDIPAAYFETKWKLEKAREEELKAEKAKGATNDRPDDDTGPEQSTGEVPSSARPPMPSTSQTAAPPPVAGVPGHKDRRGEQFAEDLNARRRKFDS